MAAKTRSIDINTAFTFVFSDPEWLKKIVVGGLLSLTLIGIVPVTGWLVELQRVLIQSGKSHLPGWDRLGDYAVNGLKFIGLMLLLQAPMLAVVAATSLWAAWNPESELAFVLLALANLAVLGWVALIGLGMGVVSGRFAETLSIRQSLELAYLLKLFGANWRQFVGAAFLGYVAAYGASLAGWLLLCVGAFFTSLIATTITYHLYAQAYRNALARV